MDSRRKTLTLCALIICGLAAIFPLVSGAASGTSAASSLSSAGSLPGDWPMYGHDAQRTSYNPDETTINTSNVSLLTQAWQGSIGIGTSGQPAYSGPVIANGKVYVASSFDDGDNFFAFNEGSGSLAWSANIGYNPAECFGIGVGSTAAVSGTLVTIGGGDAAYHGLNAADGSQLWRNPLDVGPSGFAWTSPLIMGNRVYVGAASDCDNPSVRGEVRSIDAVTGTRIASAYIVPEGLAGGGIWNSVTLSPDGSKVFANTGEDFNGYNGPYNRAMMALDPATLGVLASNQIGHLDQDQDWATTPIVFHDRNGRVLVGSGLKADSFYAYDLNNINAGPVWSWQPGLDTGNPVAYDPTFGDGGTLFISMGDQLFAINSTNGNDRWPAVLVGEAHGPIAVANGLIYIDAMGTLKIYNETNGQLVRSITPLLAGPSFASPAVSHGVVYWTSGAYLNAWGLPQPTPTATATPAPPPCPGERFTDVCPPDYFYAPVLALNDDGIVSGYNSSPPCPNNLWVPCFKPYSSSTRGQVSKIVSLAAGFNDSVAGQTFQDVPPGSTFYTYTQRLVEREIINGYECGGASEPCVPPNNLPYFRTNRNVTRGQLAKMVANSFRWFEPVETQQFEDVFTDSPFFTFIGRLNDRGIVNGYPCGGAGEPCMPPNNLPYFRPNSNITRGQTAKIVQLARTQPTPTPQPSSTPTTTPAPTYTPTGAPTGTSVPTDTATDTAAPGLTDTPSPAPTSTTTSY